jgi:hypothetical protein
MARTTQSGDDWQAGYDAAMSGGSSVPPPEIKDPRAYASGFITGQATRQHAAAASGAITEDRPAV